jgi:methylated-DNA-[protein]-cysteine S-methyltransferase
VSLRYERRMEYPICPPDQACITTPIGGIRLCGDGKRLTAIQITRDAIAVDPQSAIMQEAVRQIVEWFAGTRRWFDLPLAPTTTPRGAVLRAAIADIGYGDTLGYGTLARHIGSSARAIGQTCARNPFPIVIPCHRVLAAGNVLGAYSAGDGPATKKWLLDHEQRHR